MENSYESIENQSLDQLIEELNSQEYLVSLQQFTAYWWASLHKKSLSVNPTYCGTGKGGTAVEALQEAVRLVGPRKPHKYADMSKLTSSNVKRRITLAEL